MRRSAASWDTLWPVAKATRNRDLSSRSGGDEFSVNLGVWSRFRSFSRDHVGGEGMVGGLWLKNDFRRRSHVLRSISMPKP